MKGKTCHGCCHEAAEPCTKHNRHFPSGESACGHCVRNFCQSKGLRARDNYMTMDELKELIKKAGDERRRLIPEVVQFT